MRDGRIRRVVKWVSRAVGTLELRLRRALGSKPRYLLQGRCTGCGRCCEAPSLEVGRLTFTVKALRALVVALQHAVNGFVLTSADARFRLLVFRCTHYDPATKQCDSYASRPLICRDYPVNQTHEAVPQLFAECGYLAVDRHAQPLREALEEAGLPKEKLEEVEKKLFLGK